MKKLFAIILVLSMCLCACGHSTAPVEKNESAPASNSQKDEKSTYKEYTALGLKYELPNDWKIDQESDGSATTTNLGDLAGLQVLVKSNVPSTHFKYFGETFMVDTIKNMGYTILGTYNKNEYGSYKAYDYEAETTIQGKKASVKITALNVNDSAVAFLLVYADDNYDYEAIYSHLLSSLK